ncbi:MAG: dihydrolipoyllysine-residue acetyltransferase, partial [Gammaproteobacteria bacterium]|nr:dihydrolipoyllysine-residue acetyltransferase [Gammaproteobacteria bacterium]
VAEEDSLVTLESDKATMEIPSPEAGVIKKVEVSVGDKISQGDAVVLLELADAEAAAPAPAEKEPEPVVDAPAEKVEPAAQPVNKASSGISSTPTDTCEEPVPALERTGKSHASPAVRRFARELGVDLDRVTGTGPKNRILKEDVQNFVKQTINAPRSAAGSGLALNLGEAPQIDFAKFGEIEEQPLGRIKKISGAHLHRSWVSVPHVTQFDETDITHLENFRKDQKDYAAKQDIKLTFMPFLMKACAAALKAYPQFNSSLSADSESLIMKKYVHIGVAVDTPNGLMVPVIRNVDKKGVFQLAAELTEISAKTREGKLSPAEMQGGCFSISSLGGIGGTQFTPIVNAPEVAILGVSRAEMKPVWNGEDFDARLMMPFSLSYDHRVIDGAEGVRFTTYLGQLLGDIRKLLL